MAKISAGLLMYKLVAGKPQVFLVHPGGPFFKFNDHVWSIPKGLQEDGEDLLETAKREFCEETGISLARRGLVRQTFLNLSFVTYNDKIVYCWAFESDLPRFAGEAGFVFKSNPSKFGWPENDKGEFFNLETAKEKILPAQKEFLVRLTKAFCTGN